MVGEMSHNADAYDLSMRLSTLFLLTGLLGAYFAFCIVNELGLSNLNGGALMITIRFPLVFRARLFLITGPLFLLFVSIPVILEWGRISYEWTTFKRPTPLSGWVTWFLWYLAIPTVSLIVDMRFHYLSDQKKWIRLGVDVLLGLGWFLICCVILMDLSYKN